MRPNMFVEPVADVEAGDGMMAACHGLPMRTLIFCLALLLPVAAHAMTFSRTMDFSRTINPSVTMGLADVDLPPLLQRVNIIDGSDDRDSLLAIGPSLGLSRGEISRIRSVSGYVGCLSPSPSVGSAALFLTNQQILTAAHVFFEPSGKRRWKCFFRPQSVDGPMIDLIVDDRTHFGSKKPKAGDRKSVV